MKKRLLLLSLPFLVLTLLFMPTSGSGSSKHEKVSLWALSGPFGGMAYNLIFGLSDVVTKNHPWLNLSVNAGAGTWEGIRTCGKNERNKQHGFLLMTVEGQRAADNGEKPLNKAYPGIKAVLLLARNPISMYTTNPDIKTLKDLAGKRIALGPRGMLLSMKMGLILEAAGLLDKVKIDYLDWISGRDALRDGLVDAAMGQWVRTSETTNAVPAAALELMATRDIYLVNIDEDIIKKAAAAQNYNWAPFTVPKDALAKGLPAQDTIALDNMMWLAAYKEMPEEYVYEVTKTVLANWFKLVEYHSAAGGLTPKTLGQIPLSEADFHPGAVRAFKEAGIKIGM